MNVQENDLMFSSRVQKRLIGNCYRNLEAFYSSYRFLIIQSKFDSLDIKIPSDLFSCKECDSTSKGKYFYKQKKIVLCSNNIPNEGFQDLATKLMIQAYDDARSDIDPSNKLQMSCSLLRSVNLGGVCRSSKKYRSAGVRSGYKECVQETTTKELMAMFEQFRDADPVPLGLAFLETKLERGELPGCLLGLQLGEFARLPGGLVLVLSCGELLPQLAHLLKHLVDRLLGLAMLSFCLLHLLLNSRD